MTPVLLDRYSLTPIGTLDDCISCTVYEEVNGVYECKFQYPMTGQYYEQLINVGGIVLAQHNQTERDYFDILQYSAPINGIVTFTAPHISYRLSNLVINGGWTATDPNDLFTQLTANVLTDNPFAFVTSAGTYDSGELAVNGYANARELLLGRDGLITSCVQVWVCEFKFSYFSVYVFPQRGINRGIQIRHGKNLTNIQRDKDSGGIISAVYPYWHNADNTAFKTGSVVYSTKFEQGFSPWLVRDFVGDPLYEQIMKPVTDENGEQIYLTPAIVNASAVDFSDQFPNEPTDAKLQSAARKYMSKNSTWRSNDNITVDFIDLYGTPEYEDIKDLEVCNLGDYVAVFYPELGVVSNNVEIVSVTYDTLAERYTQMQLGTLRTTLAEVIIDSIGGNYQ